MRIEVLYCSLIVAVGLTSNLLPVRGDETTLTPHSSPKLAALPQGLTSFGAARLGDAIYVYGGHTGSAHSYSTAEQSNQLLRLDLKKPEAAWKLVSEHRRLQGLALVAHDRRLICVGGFEARNAEGSEHDLHSQRRISAYDTVKNRWSDLPALPAGRSSHDAAMLKDTLYVVGGWNMNSPEETQWHRTAWSLDLSQDTLNWQQLPAPPFQRRALAVVAHDGKIFAIGGMDPQSGPTREVRIYDPSEKTWSRGPDLLGEQDMIGFGASAWSIDGQLVVTCYNGDIQILAEDGSEWRSVGRTKDARFFHRLLPLDRGLLLSVGGANMAEGKYVVPETIRVDLP